MYHPIGRELRAMYRMLEGCEEIKLKMLDYPLGDDELDMDDTPSDDGMYEDDTDRFD